MHSNYSGKGVDQLAEVIETIKTNPDSRRIVLTAYAPPACSSHLQLAHVPTDAHLPDVPFLPPFAVGTLRRFR